MCRKHRNDSAEIFPQRDQNLSAEITRGPKTNSSTSNIFLTLQKPVPTSTQISLPIYVTEKCLGMIPLKKKKNYKYY